MGLRTGVLSQISSVVIGLSSIAPAYSIAATLGLLVLTGAGTKAVSIMLLAFVPILFVAAAFRELNSAEQDCGTNFTWATRAFGSITGWLTGWVVTVAQLLVMTSQSAITGRYTLLLFGLHAAADSRLASTAIGTVWLLGLCYLCYRGIEVSARVQWVLLGVELAVLVVFAVVALVRVYAGSAGPQALRVSWSWFSPSGVGLSGFVSAMLLAVFIYWGWESSVSVNEESADPRGGPGNAAVLSTVLLVGNYLLVTLAAVAFAGVGSSGIGLANPANSDDVLAGLGHAVFGGGWGQVFGTLLVASVLSSASASSQATIMPAARTLLSMARHGALPRVFGRVHPRYQTPSVSTWVFGAVSLALYLGLTAWSENVLSDSVSAVGLAIAIEYAVTAASCVWVFRATLRSGPRNLLLRGVLPGLGALFFVSVLVAALIQYADPARSATVVFGIGGVAVLGVSSLLIGVPLLALVFRPCRDYFAGRSLPRAAAPPTGDPALTPTP